MYSKQALQCYALAGIAAAHVNSDAPLGLRARWSDVQDAAIVAATQGLDVAGVLPEFASSSIGEPLAATIRAITAV